MRKIDCVTAAAVAVLLSTPAWSQNPYALADENWISLSGTVSEAKPDGFTLNYDNGSVKVEMDDYSSWHREGRALSNGDEVVVSGRVDDDLFETTSIEAAMVYVERLGTHFYASAMDEETPLQFGPTYQADSVVVSGTIRRIDGDTFTLGTGTGRIDVETGDMGDNPLDEDGFLKLKVGDYVSVAGDYDVRLFKNNEVEATSIVKIQGDEVDDTAMN